MFIKKSNPVNQCFINNNFGWLLVIVVVVVIDVVIDVVVNVDGVDNVAFY